jgi:hypothetical protein
VHARGTGAHGYFEVTDSISDVTSADFLQRVGEKTPLFVRFSTVAGERGTAETVRDTRGFAFKMRTNEGILDWMFLSTVSLWPPNKCPSYSFPRVIAIVSILTAFIACFPDSGWCQVPLVHSRDQA